MQAFASRADLWDWLATNGTVERELWVKLFKRGSSVASVTWDDCVIACIAHGWIDGQKKPLDDTAWLQRLTPRRPGSSWSTRNCAHAERLIAEGQMTPAGLAQVAAARADGRWDSAYAGQADMVIPPDFLAALEDDPAAKAFFATLDRKNLFPIYHRLTSARRPETRAKRMAAILAQLARGERFY
jgi:uncharacterized protein YdeI (YjbR/CyaY-like superfamily)